MRHDADPNRLLNGLLDRFERKADRSRRITARPAQGFANAADRDALTAGLSAAADAGGVTLEPDRDAPHLIGRVILADPQKLYAHIARAPGIDRNANALDVLHRLSPETEVGRGMRDAFRSHWEGGKNYLGTAPLEIDEAVALVRVADAAFADLPGGAVPLRTRSARLLGDSKAIERSLSRLLAHLRHAGLLDANLDREAALAVLGLSKFPQPVLVAGPLSIGGIAVAAIPYLGLPPEVITSVGLAAEVQAIVTIENLESFHRHVREVSESDSVVVYCGGFPAQGVVQAVRHFAGLATLDRVYHWGDIDAGGVRIGRFLEEALRLEVVPHLMDADIAKVHGRPISANADLDSVPATSSFALLARFLASAEAHSLEQEMLDPAPLPQCQS